MRKKVVFYLRRDASCVYIARLLHTPIIKFLLYLPHDNRDKRKGVGWASGRFQRIPTRRIPVIYGVYTVFIVV